MACRIVDEDAQIKATMRRLVEDVLRENSNYDEGEILAAIVRECASRASLGLLRVGGRRVRRVVGIDTGDFRIIYLYTEIWEDNQDGIVGFGYAYNVDCPELSEFGNLWAPRTKEWQH